MVVVTMLAAAAIAFATIKAPVSSCNHARCVSAPQMAQGTQRAPERTSSAAEALKQQFRRDELKQELYKKCAGCSRGFGASAADRRAVDVLIQELQVLSPIAEPTAGLEGSAGRWMGRGYDLRYDDEESLEATRSAAPPLMGKWRLIYTSAYDVLTLDASPFWAVGEIYQQIEPPSSVTNAISLYPRAAAFLPMADLTPSGQLSTVATLRVSTRAKARDDRRVGLTFESVTFDAQSFLGQDVGSLLPALSTPLPRLPGSGGADSDVSPSFFDVVFVDEDVLIIRQNEPGGVFIATKAAAEEDVEA